MIISEVGYEQFKESMRLDTDYYLPEYIEVEDSLKRLDVETVPLIELTNFIKKGIFYILAEEYRKEGVPFIRVSNIKPLLLDYKDLVFISDKKNIKEQKTSLMAGDIVISKSGTLGNVAIIPPDMPICNISQDVIGISIKKQMINPYYLASYLNSPYGLSQLLRGKSQAVQGHLTLDFVRKIKIPLLSFDFQQEIESIVKEAYKKRNEADKKYKEAEDFLNKTLGIERLDLREEKYFQERFTEIEINRRIDPDFYEPKYKLSLEHLKDGARKGMFTVFQLGEISSISKGIEVGSDSYAKEGKLFLRVSNLSEKEITISDSAEFIREDLYNKLKTKYKPMAGEVLYTKDATVGVAFPVSVDFHDFIISGGILRIKPINELDPYYLALVLNSFVCRSQAERHSIGAVIKHYTYSKIKDLQVPIVAIEKQKLISNLVEQSFFLRKEVKELIEKAKKEVESFIENNSR